MLGPERHRVAAVLIYGTWNTLQCFSFLLVSSTLSLSPKKNPAGKIPRAAPKLSDAYFALENDDELFTFYCAGVCTC